MADERVLARLTNDFVPVLVDRDTDTKWAREHNVTGVPVVHFTDAEGVVMNTLIERTADAVLEEMDSYFEIAEMMADDDLEGDEDDEDMGD